MFVITVEFTINPGHWDRFMPMMVENATRSRTDEPGCRHFDVCVDDARPGIVFLYELYDDAAAFDAHLATPHYRSFAASTGEMITHRTVHRCRRVAP